MLFGKSFCWAHSIADLVRELDRVSKECELHWFWLPVVPKWPRSRCLTAEIDCMYLVYAWTVECVVA